MESEEDAVSPEPRHEQDYSDRQVEAARRVLVDLGQVLASFADCLVVVGGWVPDLLMVDVEERHIGSMDVDLALDAEKLNSGRYAELLELLLATGRYRQGEKPFQLVVDVDLKDGDASVRVDVEFLASKDVKLEEHKTKLIEGFRVLQADACAVAFNAPVELPLSGKNVRGATNKVKLRVVSIGDFLVMKAHAIDGRDKPKDTYDLCYCMEHFPEGIEVLVENWKQRLGDKHVARAIEILQEKFAHINAFGPQQLVEFHNSTDPDTNAMHARRAYESVQKFLSLLK